MSWFGKLLGGTFGFLMGGPVGAALGAALGHQFDQDQIDPWTNLPGLTPEDVERLQRTFFISLFQVMGYLAKADGRVSDAEIRAARDIMGRMQLPYEIRLMAMQLFNEGKTLRQSFQDALAPFVSEGANHPNLCRQFIAILLEIGMADGKIPPEKECVLLDVCDALRFSRYEYQGLKTRLQANHRFGRYQSHGPNQRRQTHDSDYWQRQEQGRQPSLDVGRSSLKEAYGILGLSASARESEIKRAYRQLISRHHPDKLQAKGATAKEIELATQETQRIQKAYEIISKSRAL